MRHITGFTFIESLIIIAIVGLTLAIGIPSLSRILEQSRLHSATSSLVRSLQMARSVALMQENYTCVSKIGDSWQSGWRVFIDPNLNCVLDPGETTLLEHGAISLTVRIKATKTAGSHVLFAPSGESVLLNGGFQAGSIYVCASDQLTAGYRIVVKRGGALRAESAPANEPKCTS